MKRFIVTIISAIFILSSIFIVPVFSQDNGTLNLNSLATGYITKDNSVDQYTVPLAKAGRLDIEVMSYINGIDLYVVSSDGVTDVTGRIDIDNGSENEPKKWVGSINLDPGVYYIKIKQNYSDTGKYTLKINHTIAGNTDIEPNNSVDSAQYLKYDGDSVTGFISWSDDVDVYKLDVAKAGRENLEVMSYLNGIDMYVVASDGVTDVTGRIDIDYGSDREPKKWVGNVDLEPGTYYIKVKKNYSDTGKYTLKIKHIAAENTDKEPNNSVDSTQPLKYEGDSVTGFISWSDDVDVYKLDVTKAGRENIEVMSYLNCLDLYVVSDDGVTDVTGRIDIDYGSDKEPKKWVGSVDLEPGTYYIKVKKNYSDTGKYTLKVNHVAAKNTDKEPNNSVDSAQSLKYDGDSVTGFISWSDDVDVYRLDVKKTKRVGIEVMSYLYGIDLYVVSSDGVTDVTGRIDIDYGSENEPKKWVGSVDLKPGIYYVKVKKNYNYTGKYVLKIKDTIPPVSPKVSAVKQNTKVVSGTAEVGSTITIYQGKYLIGKYIIGNNGKFTLQIKPQKAGTIIYVYATDTSGNKSAGTKLVISK